MEDSNNNKEISKTSASKESGKISWGLFMIIVLIGFAIILIFVPKLYALVAARFGWTVGKARAIPLLLVAFFWYVWGQVCLYIKNEYNID